MGPRKLVLVEGEDDRAIFEEWYREKLGQVFFHPVDGHYSVESFTQKLRKNSEKKQIYGIIDRDFRSDEEVEKSLQEENNVLFILRRSTIESYLLDSQSVWEEYRILPKNKLDITNSQQMEKKLLTLCHKIETLVAANWVIHEAGEGGEYFGYSDMEEDQLIRGTARRLHWEEEKAKEKISQKKEKIKERLGSIEEAFILIQGKHLFHQVYQTFFGKKSGLRKEYLRKLLARTTKEKTGLHRDIRFIVEQRILG